MKYQTVLDLANYLCIELIELKGVNWTIEYLLKSGFTAEELIDFDFYHETVLEIAQKLSIKDKEE